MVGMKDFFDDNEESEAFREVLFTTPDNVLVKLFAKVLLERDDEKVNDGIFSTQLAGMVADLPAEVVRNLLLPMAMYKTAELRNVITFLATIHAMGDYVLTKKERNETEIKK